MKSLGSFFSYMNKNKIAQIAMSFACISAFFITKDIFLDAFKFMDTEFSLGWVRLIVLLVGLYYGGFFIVGGLQCLYYSWLEKKKCKLEERQKVKILETLKSCIPLEKDFLYNRTYENGNNLGFQMNDDPYFYIPGYHTPNMKYIPPCLCRADLETEEKKGKFLRRLEQKGILEFGATKQ